MSLPYPHLSVTRREKGYFVKKLLEKIKGLKPEEIMKSLTIEELRRLKELLDNIDLD